MVMSETNTRVSCCYSLSILIRVNQSPRYAHKHTARSDVSQPGGHLEK